MSEIAARVLAGDVASGARLIRWLEDGEPRGIEALKRIYPKSGNAHMVGITGPPGAGKSTLVDALIAEHRRRGRRVAVVAVDPSSPFSGGAVLGDRVRMQRHATDPDVFIRSMATRGQLGGLSRASFEATAVLDAMGYDVVMVETVGVGQDEVEVADLAHTTLVVSVPGLGDDVQAIKAGILEIGEVFVLNKADRPGAEETEKVLLTMLQLRRAAAGDWSPPLLRTVAVSEEGIRELVDACDAHRQDLVDRGAFGEATAARSERFFAGLLRELAVERIIGGTRRRASYEELLAAVRAREIDPYTAAERLVAGFGSHNDPADGSDGGRS